MRIVAIIATYNEEPLHRRLPGASLRPGRRGVSLSTTSRPTTPSRSPGAISAPGCSASSRSRAMASTAGAGSCAARRSSRRELAADWFLHLDADEIPLPPHSAGETLREALAEADAAGYNAVEFAEFTFVPTRESPDHDHPDFRRTMRWYYPFAPRPHPPACAPGSGSRSASISATSGGHVVGLSRPAALPRALPAAPLSLPQPRARDAASTCGKQLRPRRAARRLARLARHAARRRRTAAARRPSLRVAASDDDLDPRRRARPLRWSGRNRRLAGEARPAIGRHPAVVLCIVDRPGWAHDRKTDALASTSQALPDRASASRPRSPPTDLERADCVLLYYWLQVERLGAPAAQLLRQLRDRLVIGHLQPLRARRRVAGAGARHARRARVRAVFVNNRLLLEEFEPLLRQPVALHAQRRRHRAFSGPPRRRRAGAVARCGSAGREA